MKKFTILLSVLLLSVFSVSGQKTLDEVTLISPYLEYVSLDEIRDFQSYQKQHFKNPRGLYISEHFRIHDNGNVRYFRFKGSKDILTTSSILNEQSINDWEGHVKAMSEMHSLGAEGSLEFIDLKEGRGAILHLEEPISLLDAFFYQNRTAGVSLRFTYISNEDAETRVRNMKNILTSLKVETR